MIPQDEKKEKRKLRHYDGNVLSTANAATILFVHRGRIWGRLRGSCTRTPSKGHKVLDQARLLFRHKPMTVKFIATRKQHALSH